MPAQSWCAVDSALKTIGDRWTLVIIHELTLGPRRTVELHRGFRGLSTKTLLARLKKLQRAGLVSRRSFSESPPRVEYALTVKGHALLPLVREMGKSVALWDDLAAHGPQCTACAALIEERHIATEEGAEVAETGDTRSSPRPESGPGRRQIRKRRDVTLL
jgi:DNA-binding HxlR family transcriptional regulator